MKMKNLLATAEKYGWTLYLMDGFWSHKEHGDFHGSLRELCEKHKYEPVLQDIPTGSISLGMNEVGLGQ